MSSSSFGNSKLSMSSSGVSTGGVASAGTNNLHISSTGSGLFKGDLDSTLANLAQNLTFDAGPKNTFNK